MVEAKMFLALVNLLLGACIAGVSGCRINDMAPDTPAYHAAPYALMLTAGLVSATSPWQGQWPGVGQVFISFCVCLYLVTSRSNLDTAK